MLKKQLEARKKQLELVIERMTQDIKEAEMVIGGLMVQISETPDDPEEETAEDSKKIPTGVQ